MFRGLINDAKSAAGAVIAKYAVRASVAVPFVFALGFATVAITFAAAEKFGLIAAFWMVAGGFTAIGLVAAIAVTTKEQEQEIADEAAEKADTGEVASDAATQAMVQAPIALLGSLLTAAGGPSSAVHAARLLGRNLPLVLLVVMIGALFLPDLKSQDSSGDEDLGAAKPNGSRPPAPESPREHG